MTDTLSPPPAALPAAFGAAVRAAADEFFGSHCGLALTELAARPGDDPPACILGVIAFAGDAPWSFALVLPEPTAVAVSGRFAGVEVPFRSPDMGDLVGEMANVLAGLVSARLDAAGVRAELSLPTVARGRDIEFLPPADAAADRVVYATPAGRLWFEVVMARGGPAGTRRPGV